MPTTAAAITAAAVAAESEVCCLGSAHAIGAAVAVIAADVAVAMLAAIAAVTPVAIAAVMPVATIAADVKSSAASCPSARFAAEFGFRLAKPKKLPARDIVANAFASKFLIRAAAPCACLAPRKCNAA
jgi:hypothetical protein